MEHFAVGIAFVLHNRALGLLGDGVLKYMGSKRAMLANGLGELLKAESTRTSRFVDLFCGAGSVSWFAATELNARVVSCDLQAYAVVMCAAVIQRNKPLDPDALSKQWIDSSNVTKSRLRGWKDARKLDDSRLNIASWRKRAQELCGSELAAASSIIFSRYGGHYFSPSQALSFDALLKRLPRDGVERDLCLASLIIAASQCAASPGHTAQPFKATRTAGRYLREAWERNPFSYAKKALYKIAPMHASKPGKAFVVDANEYAGRLREDDLVFLDPPYSGVHYSRFYHVLETIARGRCGEVEGVGRYPPRSERPVSSYSCKSLAKDAMRRLLSSISGQGCRVVLTFPSEQCSNGLSGDQVEALSAEYFSVLKRKVETRFSTLGGNVERRAARKVSDELMLVLRPR